LQRVLVTGASGYIGGAIARRLVQQGYAVQGGIRRPGPLAEGVEPLVTGDLADAVLDLRGFDAVLHAAGLGHRRGVATALWRRANVDAAANLARQAGQAGVGRFVLISTAHVYGRVHDGIVRDDTAPNPMDDYAASKLQAEQDVAAAFGGTLSILRPVAVIGPHCPGNLQLLMRLLGRGIPLPFGAISNRRSFVQADDLARLAGAVLASPAPPKLVLAASPEAIATPDLIRALFGGCFEHAGARRDVAEPGRQLRRRPASRPRPGLGALRKLARKPGRDRPALCGNIIPQDQRVDFRRKNPDKPPAS
jgi:nucleoside-diphosphate-sugar epimerase